VWWISFSPLWSLVPEVAFLAILGGLNLGSNPLQLAGTVLGMNVAMYLALVCFVVSDRRGLLRGGNGSAASAWWILLSPLAYLIVRSIVVRRWDASAWAPLVWWVVASFLAPIVAVVSYFAVLGILPV
jgi:hypothetical protein